MRVTISQEIDHRAVMISASAQAMGETVDTAFFQNEQQISAIPLSLQQQHQYQNTPNYYQMNKDIPQPHEVPLIGSYGNIHTDFRETQMLSAYRAFNELERYEGLHQNIYTNDNEHPQTTILQQIGVETNGNSTEATVDPTLLQTHIFNQHTAEANYPIQNEEGQHLSTEVGGQYNQDPPKDENIYENETNVLIATEKNTADVTEEHTLLENEGCTIQTTAHNNASMMIQPTPVAIAHASPVVYAEATHAAVLSSSAVHHNVYPEDSSNNNLAEEENIVNSNSNSMDVLKERALIHGFESGV